MDVKKALILIAHGSRVEATQKEMTSLVQKVQEATDALVLGCYMEIQSPNLSEAVAKAVDEGAQTISVLPLFVFRGRHMIEDIPSQVEECQQKFYDREIKLLPYIGASEFFREAITKLL